MNNNNNNRTPRRYPETTAPQQSQKPTAQSPQTRHVAPTQSQPTQHQVRQVPSQQPTQPTVKRQPTQQPARPSTPPHSQPTVHQVPQQRPTQSHVPQTSQPSSQQYRTPSVSQPPQTYRQPMQTPHQPQPRQQQPSQAASSTRTYSRRKLAQNPPTHAPNGRKLKASERHRIAQGKGYDKPDRRERDNTLSSVVKAMLYIVFVIVASGFLSYYIITIGNDVFAFVKSDDVAVVTLDEYATTADLAQELYENDIIKFPKIFELYLAFRKLDQGEYLSGTFTVSKNTNYDDLAYTFKPKGVSREEISITIREGWTVNEIINTFVEKGIGTREGFIDVIQNYDFDYWFIEDMGTQDTNRTYRLEGYLYPDTYYFYTDSSEYAVIKKFLDRFNEMFDERYKESCEEVGMTVDEVIILASMIQMEGKYISEYGAISSVFHNRLKNPYYETMGFLNSDATIQYALNERKSILTGEDTELDSPYNTYQHKGLPPGPICNPSLDAMNYAMYPDETDYYYFVSRTNGYSLFAATAAEHTENINIARSGQ